MPHATADRSMTIASDPEAHALAVLADASQVGEPAAIAACNTLGRLEGLAYRRACTGASRSRTYRIVALAMLCARHRVGRMFTTAEAEAFEAGMRSALA